MVRHRPTLWFLTVVICTTGVGCSDDEARRLTIVVDGRRVPAQIVDGELCHEADDERRCAPLDDLTFTIATLPDGVPAEALLFERSVDAIVVQCSEITDDPELCP